LPADHFQKVVRIVSAYLSFLITTKGAPDQPIFSATLTLEFLCTTPPFPVKSSFRLRLC
jgi:hypothetical protein